MNKTLKDYMNKNGTLGLSKDDDSIEACMLQDGKRLFGFESATQMLNDLEERITKLEDNK